MKKFNIYVSFNGVYYNVPNDKRETQVLHSLKNEDVCRQVKLYILSQGGCEVFVKLIGCAQCVY